ALDAWNRGIKQDSIEVNGQQVPVAGIEDVAENDRRGNLIVMLPGTETLSNGRVRQRMFRIPLGHAASLLYGPMNELFTRRDPLAALKTAVLSTPGQLIPGNIQLNAKDPVGSVAKSVVGSLNPALKEPIEQMINLNTFSDSPIVGKKLAGRAQ